MLCEELSVDQRKQDVGRLEKQQLPVDELVEGALPLEQQTGKATSCWAGDISLVWNGHFARNSLIIVAVEFHKIDDRIIQLHAAAIHRSQSLNLLSNNAEHILNKAEGQGSSNSKATYACC